MDWDADRITYADQNLVNTDLHDPTEVTPAEARSRFREFFRNYHDAEDQYIYRDQLQKRWQRRESYVEIELAHVNEYDEALMAKVQSKPSEYLPMIEAAAKEALAGFLIQANIQQVWSPILLLLF